MKLTKASHSVSTMTIPGTASLAMGPQWVNASFVKPPQHSSEDGLTKYT